VTGPALADRQVGDKNRTAMDIPSGTEDLFPEDVAALFSKLAGVPISRATVLSYLSKSRRGVRYTHDPFPPPDGYKGGPPEGGRGGRPYWKKHRIPELAAWWQRGTRRNRAHPRHGEEPL
jgi:hypothetical protein